MSDKVFWLIWTLGFIFIVCIGIITENKNKDELNQLKTACAIYQAELKILKEAKK